MFGGVALALESVSQSEKEKGEKDFQDESREEWRCIILDVSLGFSHSSAFWNRKKNVDERSLGMTLLTVCSVKPNQIIKECFLFWGCIYYVYVLVESMSLEYISC